uniref:Uncharacterized protein n=1 Tax=Heterorhabditis bacteriophora TaxID=37862 RepID=A0A1I7XG16_HETBA
MDKSSLSIGLASNAVYPLVRNTANHPPDLPPRGVQKLQAIAGNWEKFSTSNKRTSAKPHWSRYRHCAKLPDRVAPIVVLKRVSRLARHSKPVDDNYIMGETALLWRSQISQLHYLYRDLVVE